MKIEIDDNYIKWIKERNGYETEQEITNYVNEVLSNHKESWEGLSSE